MSREAALNVVILVGLVAVPLWALWVDEPFTITLATRAIVLALAAVGLNIALGIGGLVSLGHAVFFGIGGYAMGILAHHAQTYVPLMEWPFVLEGTKSMPVIWLVARPSRMMCSNRSGSPCIAMRRPFSTCSTLMLEWLFISSIFWFNTVFPFNSII